jgi:hypothetical protein
MINASASSTPTGLVGVHPRVPIGVHVNLAIKGQNGAPTHKGRFWLMTQTTHSQEFKAGGGKQYRQLARDLHASFGAWNEGAMALGNDITRRGPGRFGFLRGNLVHAKWHEAARWNRAAQKLPEGHPNPPSRRPACSGNGIDALRYRGLDAAGVEIFDRIPCPNRECVFAMQGLCRAEAHLIFRLRWNPDDPFEGQFPALLAHFTTRGWESTEGLMGLLEHVLGTEALLTPEQRKFATDEDRATWRAGLAAELGIKNPSLMGMPFQMSVSDKTKAADAGSPQGKRFPVVSFSPDGDLMEWLLLQGRQRRALATGITPAGLLPASVEDEDFLAIDRHEARLEIDPAAIEPVVVEAEEVSLPNNPSTAATATPSTARPATTPRSPAVTLTDEKAARLLRLALESGVTEDDFRDEAQRLAGSRCLTDFPAARETDLMAFIQRRGRKGRQG